MRLRLLAAAIICILPVVAQGQALAYSFSSGICCDDVAGTTNCNATVCDDDGDCSGGKVCAGSSTYEDQVERSSACNTLYNYPCASSGTCLGSLPTMSVFKGFVGAPVNKCRTVQSLLCFDTTSLPDLVNLSSGTLSFRLTTTPTDTAGYNFVGSYYGWYPGCLSGDLGIDSGSDAFSTAISGLSSGLNVIALSSVNAYVSRTGKTCFRLNVQQSPLCSAGSPSNFQSSIQWAGRNHTTIAGPVLTLETLGDATNTPAATATNTATPTNTPVNTNTPTPLPTNTPTATPTATNTVVATVGPEQLQLFFKGKSTTTLSTIEEGVSVEFGASAASIRRRLPQALRIRNMYAVCDNGPGASKTLTLGIAKNGTLVTGASCSLSGAGQGAGVNTCNASFANTTTFDFAADDYATLQLAQTVASSTQSLCNVTVYATQTDGTTEQDALLMFGTGSFNASLSTTYYGCGWPTGASGPIIGCGAYNQTAISSAYTLIPRSATLSGFSVNVNAYSSTADFTVVQDAGANASDLTAAITSGVLAITDTTCTTNCAVTGGDDISVKMVQGGGNSSARYRNTQIALDGTGQIFAGSYMTLNNSTNFLGPLGWNTAQSLSNMLMVPMARRSTIQNLRFKGIGSFNNACTATAYSGSTPGSLTATNVTCTTAGSGTDLTCADTTHHTGVAEGDYVVGFVNCVGTPKPAYVAFELSGEATDTPTPDPAWTPTPTVTVTRTSTATNTPVNTPTSDGSTQTPTRTSPPTSTGTITQTPSVTPTFVDTYTPTTTPIITPGSGGPAGLLGSADSGCGCCCGFTGGGSGTPSSCNCSPTPTFTPTWTPTITETPFPTPTPPAGGTSACVYSVPTVWADLGFSWDTDLYETGQPGVFLQYNGVGGSTSELCGRGYGFAIPGTATITGIFAPSPLYARPNNLTTPFLPGLTDCDTWTTEGTINLVQLQDNAAYVGLNLQDSRVLSNSSGGYGNFTSDLWGYAWTPAKVNLSTFGLCSSATGFITSFDETDCNIYDIVTSADPFLQPRISASHGLYVCYTTPP
jgi:hypothetical protein